MQAIALLKRHTLFFSMHVIIISITTYHSDCIGLGPMLEEGVDDVGVALLSGLVQGGVSILRGDRGKGKETRKRGSSLLVKHLLLLESTTACPP